MASSITTSDTIRPAVEKIEEIVPTLHWKFSDSQEIEVGEKEKRKQFLLKDILEKVNFPIIITAFWPANIPVLDKSVLVENSCQEFTQQIN